MSAARKAYPIRRPHKQLPRILLAAVLTFAVSGASAPFAEARTPARFFGVQGWSTPSALEFAQMRRSGVGTYRATFLWSVVQPKWGMYNWEPYDQLFTRAASARVRVLPVILGSPRWIARKYQHPPIRTRGKRRAYARFVRAAAARYGSKGRFWRQNASLPRRPVKHWQVWNEPNIRAYWPRRRGRVRSYIRFVKLTRNALRRRDRRARVVLGGLPNSRLRGSISITRYLRAVYRIRRARRYFDGVAIHPYARNHRGVLRMLRRARRQMRRGRDRRTALWVTEIGWATGGKVSKHTRRMKTSRRGQAARMKATLRVLKRNRRRLRIAGVVWFSWRDRSPSPGERDWWAINTGLLDRAGLPKPALETLRKAAGGRPLGALAP